MAIDAKLNRYMRKAKQKTKVDPAQAKLDKINQILGSDAINTLLENGDLSPSSVVATLRTMVDTISNHGVPLSRSDRDRLHDSFMSSTRRRSEGLTHFQPFGENEVAAAIEEVRRLQSTVSTFEAAVVTARQSAGHVISESQCLAANLIDQLENGVTPNE